MSKTDEYDPRKNYTLGKVGIIPRETPKPASTVSEFVIKDSGQRATFESGMVRDTTEGKTDYSLVMDGPMFKRWAIHLTKGAIKYAARNWMKANGQEELARFKQSALRHFIQWFFDEVDEDHASAVFFNINGAEYVKARQQAEVEPNLSDVCADCGSQFAVHYGDDNRCPVPALAGGTFRRQS